jgi:HEPN domain-containing protein
MHNKKVAYWIDIAEYDLETAKAMLKTKRYLYVVFMCHQVLEKMLKARFVDVCKKTAPYTHNLMLLAQEGKLVDLMSKEQIEFLDSLQHYNIEARYPSYKEKMLKTLSPESCKKMLAETQEFFKWVKALSSTK